MAEERTLEDIKNKLLELRSGTDGMLWEALYVFSSITQRLQQLYKLEEERGSCGVEQWEYSQVLVQIESDLDEFLDDLKEDGIL